MKMSFEFKTWLTGNGSTIEFSPNLLERLRRALFFITSNALADATCPSLMVGRGGRSKGCNSCRKRKVKCGMPAPSILLRIYIVPSTNASGLKMNTSQNACAAIAMALVANMP
jgi:hypothetical protein